MLPVEVGTRRTYENEVKDVVVSIYQEPKTGDVRASADGYQDKWFYAMFFEWLLKPSQKDMNFWKAKAWCFSPPPARPLTCTKVSRPGATISPTAPVSSLQPKINQP